MGRSVNYYLDGAISEKKQKQINSSGDPELKANLRKQMATKECLIFLYLRWKGTTIKVYAQRKCLQKEWDSDKQRVNHLTYKKGSMAINEYLNNLEQKVWTLHDENLNNGVLTTKPDVEAIVNKLNLKDEKDPKIELVEFIKKYTAESTSKLKPSTISVYQSTLKHLENFSRLKGRKLNFKSIDIDFYNSFMSYLVDDLKQSTNTVGKYIRELKMFMGEALERGLHTSLAYQSKKFKAPVEETESIALNEKEIQLLSDLDLSHNKRLDEVRDRFVAACWLGVRFSDLMQINGSEQLIQQDGKPYIKLKSIKTDIMVHIPLHSVVEEIFTKYRGVLPKAISNQKMNKYLKELGELVKEFHCKEKLTRTYGSKRVTIEAEKYKLIGTHTARRSFATNLYLQKVPTYTIMAVTGHKTEKAFLKYIKVNSLKHAELLGEHFKTYKIEPVKTDKPRRRRRAESVAVPTLF